MDYVIVGAGPAGLQMAHHLSQAGRSYVVLEGGDAPGAFFARHPRHRTLISINKVHNLYSEPEFNLRHDWNSLLSDDERLRFANYSRELFPNADDLVRYLRDYAERWSLSIEYGARVAKIEGQEGAFTVSTRDGRRFEGKVVLLATGAVAERVPPSIPGIELATTYAQHDTDASAYENKRVAIIGRGNSAFEVANHLAGSAAIIHIMLGDQLIKHAWNTHYVGHLRAINNTILDMYQLKSLHATLGFSVVSIAKNPDGSLRLTLEEDVPHWSPPATYRVEMDYDQVIFCTGFKYHDASIFADGAAPAVDERGKYPVLSASWESTVPGVFYLGTAMAARDRRAASGFIHGFRYNVRTLFRLLEERYAATPLPARRLALETKQDVATIAELMVRRMSTASALYQLNGFCCDALVVSGEEGAREVTCIEELPLEHALERAEFRNASVLFLITLEYGFHKYADVPLPVDFVHPADPSDPKCAAFLHGVVRCYAKGAEVEEYHFGESLVVRYDRHFSQDAFCRDFSDQFRVMNENKFKNLLNRHLHIEQIEYDEKLMTAGGEAAKVFVPWSEERLKQHREQQAAMELARASAECDFQH